MGGIRLAVDYGTSNTVAVVVPADGRARVLLFDGSPLLPSAVYAGRDGELLVGRDAVRSARLDPGRFEPNPKRRVDDGGVWLADRGWLVAELIAATLGAVAGEAARVAGGAATEVVLTCPVAWGPARRAVLADAAQRAGLPPPLLVAEPVAAAAYLASLPGHELRDGQALVVYDLGAGTFDVCAIRRTGSGFEPVAHDGLDDFGGLALDELIIGRVRDVLDSTAPEQPGPPEGPEIWSRLARPRSVADRRAAQLLREDARSAKETLSRHASADLPIPLTDRDVIIGREEFDGLASPALRRTVELTMRALTASRLAGRRLAGIFLVGGSSRVPLVATLLHRASRVAPTVLEQPETVVAQGALLATSVPLDGDAGRPSAPPPDGREELDLPTRPVEVEDPAARETRPEQSADEVPDDEVRDEPATGDPDPPDPAGTTVDPGSASPAQHVVPSAIGLMAAAVGSSTLTTLPVVPDMRAERRKVVIALVVIALLAATGVGGYLWSSHPANSGSSGYAPVQVGLAISADGRHLYETNWAGTTTVGVIDTTTDKLAGTPVPIGDHPLQIVNTNADGSTDGSRLYVASSSCAPTLMTVDTTSNKTTGHGIPLDHTGASCANAVYYTAISPDGRQVWVAHTGSHTIEAFDTTTGHSVSRPFNLSSYVDSFQPDAMTFSAKTGWLYVYGFIKQSDNSVVGELFVLNTSTNGLMNATSVTGNGPGNDTILVSPDATRAYIYEGSGVSPPPSGHDPPSVETIDLTTMTPTGRTIPVGTAPAGMALSPDGRHLYVCDSQSDTVHVIDTQADTATTVHTGYYPEAVAVTHDGTRAYILGGTGTVTVLDTTTNTTTQFRIKLVD